MCLNPDEEFERAYGYVGLLGSDVWDNEKDVNYQKANLNLWIRCHEVEHRFLEVSDNSQSTTDEPVRTVQDTIPFSRLASYGDFTYNAERERMYVIDDEPAQYIENTFHCKQEDLEVWMLPEVEEEFKQLTNVSSSKWCSASPRFSTRGRELASIEQVTNVSPYHWLTQTSWPGKLLSRYPDLPHTLQTSKNLSLFREDLSPITYDAAELAEKLEEFPCPRFEIESRDDVELLTKIDCEAVRNCWDSVEFHYGDFSSYFGLNANVPEFQPVSVSFANSQQPYPSIYDTSYEAELFPYSNGSGGGYQLQPQDNSPPMYPEDQQVQNIPVFLRPPESYFNFEFVKPSWKKHQGAVLSNLVPLTSSEQYNTTGMPKQPQVLHKPVTTMSTQSHYSVSDGKVLTTQQMLALLDKWLKKIYNPRSSDFNSIYSTSCKFDKIVVNVQQHFCCLNQGVAPSGQTHSQRPLYSDVLMNESSAMSYKYDELEREAIEQYTGSDTTLHSSPHKGQAKQDLEQEGMPSQRIGPSTAHGNWQDTTSSLRLADCTPLHCNQSPCSATSKNFTLPGSKRSSMEEIGQCICSPQKKALWMKKKKKKAEKKKKCTKQKKKPVLSERANKNTESEVALIDSFIELYKHLFLKCFFEGHWDLVVILLTKEVESMFLNCFKMMKDFVDWFMILIVSKELKEDYRKNKRRLELAENVVDTWFELIQLFHQYTNCYSKIKTTIECDNRLYFDPEKITVQKPILCSEDDMPPCSISPSDEESLYSESLFTDLLKGKYASVVLNHHSLTFIKKCEWKLTFTNDRSMNKTFSGILMKKDGNFYLDSYCKETPVDSSRKSIKIVDNFPVWHCWQWKFIEGWMFSEKDVHLNFYRLNQFNTSHLETVGSSARIRIMCNWYYEYIDTVIFQKNNSKYKLLWNMSKSNLIPSKLFVKLLVMKAPNLWCFGDVQINKQSCLTWMSGCEGPCCIQFLHYTCSRSGSISPLKKKEFMTKLSAQQCSKQKREEVIKTKVRHSKSKSGITETISPENQLIINKIASGEINLPQEKPLICVLQ